MRRVVPISAPAWRRSNRSSGMKNASSSAHLRLTSASSAASSIRCAPIEKKDFIGLTKAGNVSPIGERGVLGDVDRPEGRNRIRNDAALRQSRQIFALADEARFRVGAWQAKLFGEHGGERGAGVIVGADDRGDVAIPDRCADAGDFGDRIGGAVQRLAPAANQLFEARARIVMKQKVETRTGKRGSSRWSRKVAQTTSTVRQPSPAERRCLREILHQSAFRTGTRTNGLT